MRLSWFPSAFFTTLWFPSARNNINLKKQKQKQKKQKQKTNKQTNKTKKQNKTKNAFVVSAW